MSLAEGHVRSSVSYLFHPYLGGGTGLALVLSQIFKFLSNLPTSLPANHQSWATVIKRECINASCQVPHILSSLQSSQNGASWSQIASFSSLAWSPSVISPWLSGSNLTLCHALQVCSRIWPPPTFPPLLLKAAEDVSAPLSSRLLLLAGLGTTFFHLPGHFFQCLEPFSFQLKFHFLGEAFPSFSYEFLTHNLLTCWLSHPNTSQALSLPFKFHEEGTHPHSSLCPFPLWS